MTGLLTVLNRLLYNTASSLLRRRDYLLTKATAPEQIKALLARIRPGATEHDLIRVGGSGDGGYLVPDDLERIECCFSPGVAQVAEFELALAQRGIRCCLADHSVPYPPVQHALFDFENRHLGVIESASRTTLENWVNRKAPPQGDLLLQMDIEGDEYEVIFAAGRDTLRRFRILVIEFHDLHRMIERHYFKIVDMTFSKLLQDFYVVHIHPNNDQPLYSYKGIQIPPIAEFTFLRQDRVQHLKPRTSFPHPLDVKNVRQNPDYPLPACWYQS